MSVNWVDLLVIPSFRLSFLNGIYSSSDCKAGFKCDHLARQLRECAAAASSGQPFDAKVCEIVGWEQLLCWSRYVAPDRFDAVRQCYSGKSMKDREICDPIVLDLHDVVKRHRESLVIPASDTALFASCPSFESVKTAVEANAAFDCLMNKSGQSAHVKALAECLAKSPGSDECATAHTVVMQTLGQIYGRSKLMSSFI